MSDILDAFANDVLFDELIQEGQTRESFTESNNSSQQLSNSSKSLSKSKRVPHVKHRITKDYRETCNLAVEEIRKAFGQETIFTPVELPKFTEAYNTTVTLEALLGGDIAFTEEAISPYLEHDENIHGFDSNYHNSRSVDYYEPPKPAKSNRGRKPKEPPTPARKKTGNGTSFNSQVSFLVRNVGNCKPRYFRIKVFRQGKLQIPGVTQGTIEHVFTAINHVKIRLQAILMKYYAAIGTPRELTDLSVSSITPVMKNYRFMLSFLRPKQILRLDQLRIILLADANRSPNARSNIHVPAELAKIVHVKYTPEDPSKLSVVFSTPIPGKPDKATRINVFSSGRFNVLGAFEASATNRICKYMHDIVEANHLMLIATVGVPFLCGVNDPKVYVLKLCLEGLLKKINQNAHEMETVRRAPKKSMISRGKTIMKRIFK